MTARPARWYEPRLTGHLQVPQVPAGFFERLAAGVVTSRGLQLVDEDGAPVAYRSAAFARSLSFQVRRFGLVGSVDRVHVWQQGAGTLRYEATWGRSAALLVAVTVAFWAIAASLAARQAEGPRLDMLMLVLGPFGLQYWQRRWARAWVEELLWAELRRAPP